MVDQSELVRRASQFTRLLSVLIVRARLECFPDNTVRCTMESLNLRKVLFFDSWTSSGSHKLHGQSGYVQYANNTHNGY